MLSRSRLWWLVLFLFLPACRGSSGQHAYPEDPLFVISKPIETPAAVVSFNPSPYAEPALPPVPPLVLAASQQHTLPNLEQRERPLFLPGIRVQNAETPPATIPVATE